MPDIYINTERPIDRAIVAGINQPQREAPIGAFMAGSSYDVNLYFVKNNGTYDAASGDAGASVQVAISTLGKPQSGTFTLSDWAATTSALNYGATALEVQTALNALNSGAGIDGDSNYATSDGVDDAFIDVDLSAEGAGNYYFEFNTNTNAIVNFGIDTGGTSISSFAAIPSGNWVTATTNTVSTTPDRVTVGSYGDGLLFQAANWSNVKLYKQIGASQDTAVDTLVGFWKLDNLSSGSLDGKVAYDLSGNGYNGTFTGGTGGRAYILANTSQVTVEKVTDQQYAITFDELSDRDVISGSTVSLYPESTPTASIAVAGSATTNAQQIIEITRQPAVYDATWSTIANGFTGTLALNTTRLLQSLLIDAGMPFYIEVKLNGATVAKEVIGIELSTMPASAFSATGLATLLDSFAASPASNGAFSASTWAAALKLNVYGQFYIFATAQTTITTAGTFVKLAGSTASNNLNGITMPTNNRLQNNSGKALVFQAMARTDIVDGAGNKSISIKLAKNGVVIDETESDGYTTNNIGAHCTINWILSLADGDYVEIWATNISDTSSITANHANLLLNAIDY
jgi:hypothetical protein